MTFMTPVKPKRTWSARRELYHYPQKGPPQKILEAPQRKKEAPQRGKNYFPSIPTIPTANFAYSEGLMDQKFV